MADQENDGFAIGPMYDGYREEQQSRRQQQSEDADNDLEGTDAEIARLMHKKLQREARDEEIGKLTSMVQSSYSASQLQQAEQYSENVAKAYTRAAEKGSFAATEQFEREMERAREEEDFLLLAIITMS